MLTSLLSLTTIPVAGVKVRSTVPAIAFPATGATTSYITKLSVVAPPEARDSVIAFAWVLYCVVVVG